MTLTIWKIELQDPIGYVVEEMELCLELSDFWEDECPIIFNHPLSLLDCLVELSKSHSTAYPVIAVPNSMRFVRVDPDTDLDPIWSGSWSQLAIDVDTDSYTSEESENSED